MNWREMYLMNNIVKLGGNICVLLYYKVSLVAFNFTDLWTVFWKDYDRSIKRVIDPQYIVDESHKYSTSAPYIFSERGEYTNPIIQKEKGFI